MALELLLKKSLTVLQPYFPNDCLQLIQRSVLAFFSSIFLCSFNFLKAKSGECGCEAEVCCKSEQRIFDFDTATFVMISCVL